MRIVLHCKRGRAILVNENWTTAEPGTDSYGRPQGTKIWWGETFIEVRESFEEFCEAMKASRRFSNKDDKQVPDVQG